MLTLNFQKVSISVMRLKKFAIRKSTSKDVNVKPKPLMEIAVEASDGQYDGQSDFPSQLTS